MDFHYFIYQSKAADNLKPSDIDAILTSAKAYNKESGITGVLLYDENSFLQFIEGPKVALIKAYHRIKSASQHHSIFELANEPSEKKYFQAWDMGFCKTTHSNLQSIANAGWVKSIRDLREPKSRSDGLELLLDYWDAYREES